MNTEAYTRLEKALKTAYENISVLHHNIVGRNFFADHEKLGEYYDLISGMSDAVIENGTALGIKEPVMSECLAEFEEIPAEERGAAETYIIVSEIFNRIAELMEEVRDGAPSHIVSMLDEYQYKLNLEANYKIEHLLKGE